MLLHDHYLMARHEARFHVVVEILSAQLIGHTPGPMRMEGRVVEVFRTDGTLKVGDGVHFVESVKRPGEEVPFGGTRWKQYEELLEAHYLEAFLEGDPPACAVALWQSEVVPAPTGKPRLRGWYPLVAFRQRRLRRMAAREASWWRWLLGRG